MECTPIKAIMFAVRLLSQSYSQPVAHNKLCVAKHSICLARQVSIVTNYDFTV